MTVNSPPYALQAGSHSAQLFRQAISTLLGSAGGIVASGDYAVTQNGVPNMSVNVAGGVPGGQIWVPGTSSAGVQGLYYGFNDGTVNLAIAASNPTNPRIDIAVAQVQDATYAGAVNSFQLAIVTGTPAGSPVAPSTPASSLKLANIAVAANATTVVTGNITDTRTRAAFASLPFAAGAISIASLADPTAGKVIGSSGGVAAAVNPPGFEFGYDQITADVSVTGASEAAATTVIACAAHTFDGSPVIAEFYTPGLTPAVAAASSIDVFLAEGATHLGIIAETADLVSSGTSRATVPAHGKLRFTPTAGAHTYTVAAWQGGGNGTVRAGLGGTGAYMPAFARFTKA